MAYGKTVEPGAFGVPWGNGAQVFDQGVPFTDGNLVYDDQISFELVDTLSSPISVAVSAEEWTPGTVTVYVNATGPNGTIVPTPVQEPARLDATWSNGTVTALPGAPGELTLPLPYAGSTRLLEVTAGSATWQMSALTPAASSLAGIYTVGGLDLALLTEGLIVFIVMLAFLEAARRFGKRVYRTPRVPAWWPVAWIGIPLGFFFLDYVPTNQLLGGFSPLLYPFVLGMAAFPYLPRAWRNFRWARFQGVDTKNLEVARSAEAILPVVEKRSGYRCAPETWWEVFWTLAGVDLPEIQGELVTSLGRKLRVQPRGMETSSPLGAYYESDADLVFWFDARAPLQRRRHAFRWWREQAAGDGPKRRRFSPHVEPGCFEGRFPPIRPVAEELAGILREEREAHDNEVDRLMVANLLGDARREAREAAAASLASYDRAVYEETRARTREEIREAVQRGQTARRRAATEKPDERSE